MKDRYTDDVMKLCLTVLNKAREGSIRRRRYEIMFNCIEQGLMKDRSADDVMKLCLTVLNKVS